jgi:hypothetical protein
MPLRMRAERKVLGRNVKKDGYGAVLCYGRTQYQSDNATIARIVTPTIIVAARSGGSGARAGEGGSRCGSSFRAALFGGSVMASPSTRWTW